VWGSECAEYTNVRPGRCTPGSSYRHPLDRMLRVPQYRSGWCGKKTDLTPKWNRSPTPWRSRAPALWPLFTSTEIKMQRTAIWCDIARCDRRNMREVPHDDTNATVVSILGNSLGQKTRIIATLWISRMTRSLRSEIPNAVLKCVSWIVVQYVCMAERWTELFVAIEQKFGY
jgi:hypothetical protein